MGSEPSARLEHDEASRAFATDPAHNVVLEASAGTGKTHVLVTRYINLLKAGVDPANILAITFTRKAAAEMRERILRELRTRADRSAEDAARWASLRDRLADIAISTIDAFCFSLLREFPLEADLDPGFDVADETITPRLVDAAVDGAIGAARRLASTEDVGLLLAALGESRVRAGLEALVGRRLAAAPAMRRFLGGAVGPAPSVALDRLVSRLRDVFGSYPGGIEAFIADGPAANESYALVAADLRALAAGAPFARAVVERLSRYVLTNDGTPRSRLATGFKKDHCRDEAAYKRHLGAVTAAGPEVVLAKAEFERHLNVALVRAVGRLFRIARRLYRKALEAQASLDFTEGLSRTVRLLREMDEFARSRYRLEARYHHVLVDEFQDTNPAQWRLIARLIASWGEGIGLAHGGPLQPSIFVVGDRKQSIYAFRDADVRMLHRAGRHVAALRPDGRVRRSIARSYRAAPELLAFTNDLFSSIDTSVPRRDAFRFTDRDRFPVDPSAPASGRLTLVAAPDTTAAAQMIAAEVEGLLATGEIQDRQTKETRPVRPGDIAILFRSRASHREIETALEARGVPTYVYKGLGFFDADEVKDLLALLRYLARPSSALCAAALMRSRLVRLSDPAVRLLAPSADAVLSSAQPAPEGLSVEDRSVLDRLRASLAVWLPLVDRVPPAELLDRIIADAAYAFELRGPRLAQARENLKKVRAMTRRMQNRGYATMERVAEYLGRLSTGDESNAVVDALDSVNLMTVHAAKGLEFPIVFVTNLQRGTGGGGDPVVIVPGGTGGGPLVSVGGHLPEADEAARARDREETKRLLYVAVTRARERLYLGAVLKDGAFKARPGSLGEVLPASLGTAFAQAATGAGPVVWQPEHGRPHVLGAAPRPAGAASVPAEAKRRGAGGESPAADVDVEPVADTGGARYVAAAVLARLLAPEPDDTPGALRDEPEGPDPVLVGTVVHRLFEASATTVDLDERWLAEKARVLADARAEAVDARAEHIAAAAVEAFLGLRRRPDVAGVLEGAACEYELPFSLRLAEADGSADPSARLVVRGSIDCLARRPDGTVVVLELKTGRRHDWHRQQLDLYVRAARALFPGATVEGRLVYLDTAEPAVPTI